MADNTNPKRDDSQQFLLWKIAKILQGGLTSDGAVQGPVADGEPNTSDPVVMGAEAVNPDSLGAQATAGDAVTLLTDLDRNLLVRLATALDPVNDRVASPVAVSKISPDISTDPYVAGDCLGSVNTLTGVAVADGRPVELTSVHVVDFDDQKAEIWLLFFASNVDQTGATVTDNSAFAWGSMQDGFLGIVKVLAANYQSVASRAVASLNDLGSIFVSNDNDIKVLAVVNGTPTYTAGAAIAITFGFKQH